MLKLIGVLMIAASCSAMGFSMNGALKHRVAALCSFISAFQIIHAEIVFKQTSLTDIFKVLKRENIGVAARFFGNIAVLMEEKRGQSFWSAFCSNIPLLATVGLLDSDCEIIATGARVIGRYDAESQSEILTSTIKRLEVEMQKAQVELSKKGKLYRAIGVSAGIMISLIII